MRVQFREGQGESECHVLIDSHLGFDVALECMRELRGLDYNRIRHLVFDLSRTPSIESAGVGLLMHTHERWGKRLRSSAIRCVRGQVHDILCICRMHRYYQINLLY